MKDKWMLEHYKKNYRELIVFKRQYLRRSKRKLIWSSTSISGFNGDTMQTVARILVDWDILDSADLVIDFYEKPWKWEHEICLLVQILDYADKDDFDGIVFEVIQKCINSQAGNYYAVMEIVNNEINEIRENISYYKKQLEVA